MRRDWTFRIIESALQPRKLPPFNLELLTACILTGNVRHQLDERYSHWQLTVKRRVLRILPLLFAIGVAIYFFSRIDLRQALVYVEKIGYYAPLVLVPYLLMSLCDAGGWKYSFARSLKAIKLRELLWIRIATEATANSLPAGLAVCETLKVILLNRRLGVAPSEAAANGIVTKFSLGISHGLFLILGLSLASEILRQNSIQLTGRPGLQYIGFAVAAVFLMITVAATLLLFRGNVVTSLFGRLQRLPVRAWQRWLTRHQEQFHDVDHNLSAVSQLPKRQMALSVGLYFVGWFCSALENYLILTLLGAHATFDQCISLEAVISIIRLMFFFIPSSIGIQEVVYFTMFRGFGFPDGDAIAAAFIIIKRLKEICWIATGYALLSVFHVPVATIKAETGKALSS
jgi:uncharacterized membrane protein YbhN (UPF0104 family)